MYGDACRALDSWMPQEQDWDEWGPASSTARRISTPGRGYSKRSALLADLRSKSEWATQNVDHYIGAPSREAQHSAKNFINNLPDACLDPRLGVSQDGEINFFFGHDQELFQILIDASGSISFFANPEAGEFGDSDIAPDQFPYLKLLAFVDRNK